MVMAQLSDHSTLVVSIHQVSCDLAGEAAILNLNDGVYYGLDPVGSLVWGLLQQPTTVAEIRSAILAEYDVDPGRCDNDLKTLLADLLAHGLVEVIGEEAC